MSSAIITFRQRSIYIGYFLYPRRQRRHLTTNITNRKGPANLLIAELKLKPAVSA